MCFSKPDTPVPDWEKANPQSGQSNRIKNIKIKVTYVNIRMPPHIIHRKWAKKLGLRLPYLGKWSLNVNALNEIFKWDVDSMIDFPEHHIDQFEQSDLLKSLKVRNRGLKDKMEQNLNDLSRVDKEVMHAYLYLLEPKGKDYVKAFFLHHLLDILDGQHIVEGRNSLLTVKGGSVSFEFKGDFLKVVKKHNLDTEFEEVSSFVREHKNEILQDLNSLSHN